MKINGSFFKNLNTNVGTGKFKLFKSKKARIITSLSLLLAATLGVTGLVGCNAEKDKGTAPTTNNDVVATNPVETPTEETKEDEFSLLAERLNISGLTMSDRLTGKIQAEVQAQLEAMTPEGGTIFSPDEVYVADDGTTWVSEEDAKEFEEKGESVTVESGYLAPDGNVWASEADYLAYINGQKDTTVIVEGDFYTAPDGTIWTSKDEYDAFVASNNGTVEIPVENGEVVEVGDGYRAPDGTYWSSEQDYLEFVEGQKNNTAVDTTQPGNTTDNEVGIEGDYYVAPDGTVWSSEQDYLDYIGTTSSSYSVQESSRIEESSYVEETTYAGEESTYVEELVQQETEDVQYDGDFYLAPDGSLWSSESDYLSFVGSDTGTASEVEEVVTEVVTEEAPVIEESGDFYVDENGDVWASYEDYLAYKESLESSKTK